MKIIILLIIVANLVGVGMAFMHALNKDNPVLKFAWGSSLLGWCAALIGALF